MSLLRLYYGKEGCASAVLDCIVCGILHNVYIVRYTMLYICLKKDILYICRIQIHMVKNMWGIFVNLLEILMNNLEILMPTLWASFAVYTTWYLASAKHYAPLTLTEAKILWRIHKQNVQCKAKKWREIRRRGKIIGFECECGYKHIQKRPVSANTPTLHMHSETPLYNKLHKPV